METLEAIRTRRSIGKVRPERPSRELIEKLLDAAMQAPNHHHTQPWRFFVLCGKARSDLGTVMGDVLRQRLADPDSEKGQALLEREMQKPLRAPVVIAVAVKRSDNPKIIAVEDVEATAAAVQNMLLAAHDLGLGAIWRTGDAAYDPAVKKYFGLGLDDNLAGFIYVGYPEATSEHGERVPGWDKVEWRGWG